MDKNDNIPALPHFIALETRVWEALVLGDAKADAALLTDDFLGVYPSGFSGRDDHAGQLVAGPVMREYALDQARLMVIGADHVMLSYRATYARVGGDSETMFISSLWQRAGDDWRNSFSQDTPAA
ncbi:MAG: DUF4440 domain-containing protein [Rhodobacteraceae bacterium]|nr:MAG: DUF4440 domain-containing protein [Paracoccaceae bacterium]